MKKDIKKRWIDALLSGEYTQGRGCLASVDGTFCCLGVLCELAVMDGAVMKTKDQWDNTNYRYGREKEVGGLPKEVMEWAGLAETIPFVITRGDTYEDQIDSQRKLSALNDEGKTFTEIAEILRRFI